MAENYANILGNQLLRSVKSTKMWIVCTI